MIWAIQHSPTALSLSIDDGIAKGEVAQLPSAEEKDKGFMKVLGCAIAVDLASARRGQLLVDHGMFQYFGVAHFA